MFFHLFLINQHDLVVVDFDEPWYFYRFHREVAVGLNLNIFFLLFNITNVSQFLEAFNDEPEEISKVLEYVLELESVEFGSRTLQIIGYGIHQSFFNRDSMCLTDKVVAHEALEAIDERHVLSQTSHKSGHLELIVV